jgi:hypothetical protein
MALAWTVLGSALSLIGTAMAGWALLADWREHAGGAPLIRWWPRAVKKLKYLLRRRRMSATVMGGAVDAVIMADGVVAELRPGIPDGASVEDQLRVIQMQFRHLEEKIDRDRREAERQGEAMTAELTRVADESRKAAQELRESLRSAVTGRLRTELWGLVLVGLGTIAAAVPALFGIN